MEDKNSATFPDPFAPRSEKEQDSYGLAQAKAIWQEYSMNSAVYDARRTQDRENRKYAEGLVSFDKYKERFNAQTDNNGDTSWLNLDYQPVNRIASLVDNLEGKMTNQEYKIQCNPIDIISKTQEDKDRDEMYANMFLKQQTGDIEQMTGIPMYPRDKHIPETTEEAEIYFKMNYKQASSIAMEQALQFVFMNNEFDSLTRKKVIRDLIVLKRACIHRYYDENNNICVRYVDPVDVITPYSKYDDFRNIPYIAVLEQMPISDIAQITTKFSEEKLAELAKRFQGQYGNGQWNNAWLGGSYEGYYPNNPGAYTRPYYNFNIPVLSFYFVTTCKENWVATTTNNGRIQFDKKDEKYVAGSPNKELISKNIQYVFEGKWVVGDDTVFNYHIQHNIPREDGGYSPKAELPMSMIAPNILDMQNKSFVERLIVFEDQLNITHLKIQQLLIQAKPPGMWINTQAMSGIILGQGDAPAKPTDIYRMYAQTGSILGSDIREDGSIINGKPFEYLPNGIGADFAVLVNYFRQQLQNMNDVIGYNSAVDASSPDVETAVGTSKMAIQATNNAIRPLYQAFVRLIEKAARGTALMIQQSITFNYDDFVRAIGAQATKTIEYGKKLAYNQFAIKIELLPDDEEKMALDNLVTLGLEKGTLTTSDAVRIRQEMKQDVKIASQFMVYLEGKNRKDRMEEAAAQQQQNGAIQKESAIVAAKAQSDAAIAQVNAETESEKVIYGLKGQLSAQEHLQKMDEIRLQMGMQKSTSIETAHINHDSNIAVEAFKAAVAPPEKSEAE